MPARVVDGEGIWRSSKLKKLPPEYRAEYANLVPLAEANGVFDCDPDRVWSDVYAYNRPEFDVEKVEDLLDCLASVDLLRRWSVGEKKYAYWTGIYKSGRLPSETHLKRYKGLPPMPPDELLGDDFIPDQSRISPGPVRILPVGFGIGMDRIGIGLEPAVQENFLGESDMKVEKEIKAVCAGFGVKPGGYKNTWDDMSVLAVAHSVGAVVRDFTEWMEENQGDDFRNGPVASYLHVAHDRLASETPAVASAKDPEVVNLVRELSYVSGGQITFLDKQKIRLAEVLKEFKAEEITTVFKTWLGDQDLNDPKTLQYGPGKFVQMADSMCYALRRGRVEKLASDKARELAAKKLQEDAEVDRQARERIQSELEDFDPLADLV